MTETAYERHLARTHALTTRRVRSGAARLGAEIARAPVTQAALRAVRGEAAAAIARGHEAFAAAFSLALRDSFEAFLRPAAPRPAGQWLDLGAFEIMDESRIQDEIEVAQAVRLLEEDCAVELRRLVKFEAALRRHEGVRVATSPFAPPSLARALWTASEGLAPGAPVRAELVRCLARWLAPRLAEMYAAARQAGFADASHLEAADREPASAEDASTVAAPTGFDVTRPGALFELMDLDDQRPVFAASTAPAPLERVADTQPMPLDGDDPRIPALIHSHREDLAALGHASSARPGAALIGHLFDRILATPALSAEARDWIGRLRPAVVQVAARDATLLQSHRHPAWTLVNRIATPLQAGKAAPPPEFLQGLADAVAQVTAEPTSEVFQAAVDRLAQWQRRQAQQRLAAVEGALDLLRRNASLEALVAQARATLQRQLDSAHAPSPTRRFILTLWSLVLAQEWAALPPGERRRSPALDTAADVIWSTDKARSRVDAPTLVAMIPELVARLTAGMATVPLSDAMKAAWLEQIAAIHLHAMRRPAGEHASAGPVTVDLALDDEVPPPAAAPAEAPSPIAALQVGDSLAVQLEGDWIELQLLWTSDNGYFLLFAGPDEQSRSFTRKALEAMLAQGLARLPAASSALQRAGDEILRGRR